MMSSVAATAPDPSRSAPGSGSCATSHQPQVRSRAGHRVAASSRCSSSAASATAASSRRRWSLNLLVDNAYLIVLAVGMTFVILTGGIDLSVGAVVALSDHDRGRAAAGWLAARRRDPADPGADLVPRSAGRADDPRVRGAALHRDARRDVPGPRPLLRDQQRTRSRSRPVLRRPWRRRRIPLGGDVDDLAERRSSRSSSWSSPFFVLQLHPVRPHRLRHRRQRAVRRC